MVLVLHPTLYQIQGNLPQVAYPGKLLPAYRSPTADTLNAYQYLLHVLLAMSGLLHVLHQIRHILDQIIAWVAKKAITLSNLFYSTVCLNYRLKTSIRFRRHNITVSLSLKPDSSCSKVIVNFSLSSRLIMQL